MQTEFTIFKYLFATVCRIILISHRMLSLCQKIIISNTERLVLPSWAYHMSVSLLPTSNIVGVLHVCISVYV